MKIFNEEIVSEYAYNKCLKKDKERYWNLIVDSFWAYMYCRYVKDREEMWKKIVDSYWACWYCENIKDRPEVRKYIK